MSPPYGILAIITSLLKAGYKNTSFYHIDLLRPLREEAIDYIVSHNPDVIGISTPTSTNYGNCKYYTIEIKKRLPNVTIILGGNMAASAEVILRRTGVDFCVLGEGERVCCQLFDKITENRSREEICKTKGLAFLEGESFVNTGYAEQIPKEEIYDVDWDILDSISIKHYFRLVKDLDQRHLKSFFKEANSSSVSYSLSDEGEILNKSIAEIFCSKGCVTHCTFCHRFSKGIRIVPPDIVISRIKELIKRFNVGVIFFSDECFGANIKWLLEFCELIKPLNLLWRVSGMRVKGVSPDIIKIMKDAGCRSIIYGMETGSERMLQVMEKMVSLEDNYNAMRWTIEAGLYTVPQLVIAMPGETSETIKETADFLSYALTLDRSQNPKNISINFVQALPGTPLYEYGRDKGLMGVTTEEEEQYLLAVSNVEAADGAKTINFTDYPCLIILSWPRFIRSIVNYRYVKMFGLHHYYTMIFQEDMQIGILHLLKNRKFSVIFYLYPVLVYRLRHFLWIVKLMEVFRTNGLAFTSVLLREYLAFIFNKRRKRFSFEYKSLRKIIDQDIKKAYAGTKEMISLRKGR
jgi:radical SAM superfamily enzyme YgiQ (UPF0313 family)